MIAALDRRATAIWAGVDRSEASKIRALEAGAEDVGTVEQMASAADIIVSICPPAAAEDVAEQVAASGFDGVYVDANAISPATAERVAARFDRFVDGAVIGPPPDQPGTTRLYLAGPCAGSVAEVWAGTALEAVVLPVDPESATGAASALKMAYAGWTKGQSSLLLAVNTLAKQAGVDQALHDEWDRSQPGLSARSDAVAAGVGPKAWRFEGEMREIAATMDDAGLPEAFHLAAADLYHRLAGFKDHEPPTLDEVTTTLLFNPDQ